MSLLAWKWITVTILADEVFLRYIGSNICTDSAIFLISYQSPIYSLKIYKVSSAINVHGFSPDFAKKSHTIKLNKSQTKWANIMGIQYFFAYQNVVSTFSYHLSYVHYTSSQIFQLPFYYLPLLPTEYTDPSVWLGMQNHMSTSPSNYQTNPIWKIRYTLRLLTSPPTNVLILSGINNIFSSSLLLFTSSLLILDANTNKWRYPRVSLPATPRSHQMEIEGGSENNTIFHKSTTCPLRFRRW